MTSVVEYYRNSIRTGAYHEMRYNLLKCAVHLLEMCAIIDATGFLTQTQTDDVIHIFDLPLSIAIQTKRMKKKTTQQSHVLFKCKRGLNTFLCHEQKQT